MILNILRIVAAIATILTGAVSLFWPLNVQGFTGLTANGGRGITEIRTHDADNRIVLPVQGKTLANCLWIAAHMGSPKTMAQNRHVFVAW